MKTRFKFFALAGVGLLAVTFTVQRVPQPPQFCSECVMAHEVTDWRLAGRWTVFSTAKDSETPVSRLLAGHKIIAPHTHRWAATECVAEENLETPDAPRVRTVGLLNAPRAVAFLRGVLEFTTAADAARWRELAWQPMIAGALDDALRFCRFPEDGFATRGEFLAWWRDSSYPLFSRLNEMTVAD